MSDSPNIAQMPLRTTLGGALAILVPIALIVWASAMYAASFSSDVEQNRKDIDENTENRALITAAQIQNTIDLNVLTAEVKNTDENVKNLTTLLNTVIESL